MSRCDRTIRFWCLKINLQNKENKRINQHKILHTSPPQAGLLSLSNVWHVATGMYNEVITKLAWFSRLLRHSAWKRGGLILQPSRAHTGWATTVNTDYMSSQSSAVIINNKDSEQRKPVGPLHAPPVKTQIHLQQSYEACSYCRQN